MHSNAQNLTSTTLPRSFASERGGLLIQPPRPRSSGAGPKSSSGAAGPAPDSSAPAASARKRRLQAVVLRVAILVPVVDRLGGGIDDVGDGLDVLESELHRHEQAQRRAVLDGQRP